MKPGPPQADPGFCFASYNVNSVKPGYKTGRYSST